MNFLKYLSLCSVVVVAVGVVSAQSTPTGTPTDICAAAPKDEPATREYSQAEQVLDPSVDYRAVFCTEAGAVYVDLYEKYAPVTVNNFVFLAQNGYYNNTTFHRVLEQFMAQGGDPTGTGSGGPGYSFEDEFNGFLRFDREGLLAMANAGANTNGSQFFITTTVTDWLDYNHTIFGDVLEGYENVTALKLRDPQANPTEDGAKLETVVIITDPAQVTSTFTEEIPVATQQQFHDGLSLVIAPEAMGTGLEEADSGAKSVDDVVGLASTDLQGEYRDYLTRYNFQFREVVEVKQSACSADFPFDLLGYRVDAFGSEEDALNAINDEFVTKFYAEKGYEAVETDGSYRVFTLGTQSCNGGAGVIELMLIPRGRYVATVYGLFVAELTTQFPPRDLLVNKVSPIFEAGLSEAYRSELR